MTFLTTKDDNCGLSNRALRNKSSEMYLVFVIFIPFFGWF